MARRPHSFERLTHAEGIEWTATGVLLVVTFFWGTSFLVLKNSIADFPVFAFLGWRFVLATLVLVALRPAQLLRASRAQWRQGAIVGAALASAYIASTYGLRTTPASVSGFLVGMYVVLAPLIAAIVLRRRIPRTTWAGVALALLGLALISVRGFSIAGGEAITLVSALFVAIHLLLLERWSTRANAYRLAIIQLGTVAVICLAAAPLDGGWPLPTTTEQWVSLVYLAVAASAFAFLGQTWAQSILPAARCAVIMTMEPVFAGIAGVVVGGEPFTWRLAAGGVAIVVAMLVVELGPRRAAATRPPLAP